MVDRHHRGRILAICLTVQAAVALLLFAAAWGRAASVGPAARLDPDHLRALLLAMSGVLGGVRAFQMPAQQALSVVLVPPRLLPRAMAFSSVGLQSAIIGGPALAGLRVAGDRLRDPSALVTGH